MGLAEGAAEDAEVVPVDEDLAAVDRSPAGDHAVPVGPFAFQAEAGGPVPAQSLHLGEGALVQQQVDALAHGALAAGVLALGGRRVGAAAQGLLEVGQFDQALVHGRGGAPDRLFEFAGRVAGGARDRGRRGRRRVLPVGRRG